MKRAFALTVLLALGCVQRDRTVIVKEPVPGQTPEVQPTGTAIAGDDKRDPQIASDEPDWGIKRPDERREYARVIEKVAKWSTMAILQSRVQRRGLAVQNVNWEDTGRAEGSALGPNISDLTLQVRRQDESGSSCRRSMPVIRFPNFADRTGDIPSDRFFVRVGNERRAIARERRAHRRAQESEVVRLDARQHPRIGNLLAPRDTHFLVSAQAVFLPIPKSGKAQFNPVLFNYQSAPGSPAVLSILITRQGTSIQVIENKTERRRPRSAGGKSSTSTTTASARRSPPSARATSSNASQRKAGPKTEDDSSALQKGADVLFLVQVPLVHANQGRLGGVMPPQRDGAAPAARRALKAAPAGAALGRAARLSEKSDVEQAVLGHGPNLGPFNEGHDLRFVRDLNFPIRITVQFYKATSNGVVERRGSRRHREVDRQASTSTPTSSDRS